MDDAPGVACGAGPGEGRHGASPRPQVGPATTLGTRLQDAFVHGFGDAADAPEPPSLGPRARLGQIHPWAHRAHPGPLPALHAAGHTSGAHAAHAHAVLHPMTAPPAPRMHSIAGRGGSSGAAPHGGSKNHTPPSAIMTCAADSKGAPLCPGPARRCAPQHTEPAWPQRGGQSRLLALVGEKGLAPLRLPTHRHMAVALLPPPIYHCHWDTNGRSLAACHTLLSHTGVRRHSDTPGGGNACPDVGTGRAHRGTWMQQGLVKLAP